MIHGYYYFTLDYTHFTFTYNTHPHTQYAPWRHVTPGRVKLWRMMIIVDIIFTFNKIKWILFVEHVRCCCVSDIEIWVVFVVTRPPISSQHKPFIPFSLRLRLNLDIDHKCIPRYARLFDAQFEIYSRHDRNYGRLHRKWCVHEAEAFDWVCRTFNTFE